MIEVHNYLFYRCLYGGLYTQVEKIPIHPTMIKTQNQQYYFVAENTIFLEVDSFKMAVTRIIALYYSFISSHHD